MPNTHPRKHFLDFSEGIYISEVALSVADIFEAVLCKLCTSLAGCLLVLCIVKWCV